MYVEVGLVYTTESIMIAAGVTVLLVLALTIFAFQVLSCFPLNLIPSLPFPVQTKVDFTACRGVMACVLLVFVICGFIMIFVPYTRHNSHQEYDH